MSTITLPDTGVIPSAAIRMKPPSRFGDKAFEWLTLAMALTVVLLVILIGWQLWHGSTLAIK
jgi:ABC-type phosphate transport system permease subunit